MANYQVTIFNGEHSVPMNVRCSVSSDVLKRAVKSVVKNHNYKVSVMDFSDLESFKTETFIGLNQALTKASSLVLKKKVLKPIESTKVVGEVDIYGCHVSSIALKYERIFLSFASNSEDTTPEMGKICVKIGDAIKNPIAKISAIGSIYLPDSYSVDVEKHTLEDYDKLIISKTVGKMETVWEDDL